MAKKLNVHDNKRYLMWEDSTPFFYLGDTAWELFHRLTRAQADYYLSVRASQGFNVIQAVALAECCGLSDPNAYGRVPLLKKDGCYDPASPDEGNGYDYWQHVDYVVDEAARNGLFIGLLPTWGDKLNLKWGQGPEVFTPKNAAIYGEWIANRYKNRWNIIWILGGDRPLETKQHLDIISSMAEGIRKVDQEHLITFHPMGDASSADCVLSQPYVDFHTVQSGHGLNSYQSWNLVRRTREAEQKPFMDSEPRYEDHPACFKAEYGYLWDAADVRQNAYWDLMEGVCGHTYGNHSVWKFNTEPSAYWPFRWEEVLFHEGACQMQNLMKLRTSRPYYEFRSAPELIQDDPAAMAHQCAGRGETYAFLYSPLGLPIRAYLKNLGGAAIKASWFDPRNAYSEPFAIIPANETLFVPPSSGKGNDWVLILDVVG